MSLPACQERALSSIEGALKASEPHLASMFAIFTRLNQDEPVGAEPLARVPSARGPLRWLRPRRALSAIVLIPVMFAAVIVASLFSGSARGATPSDVGYPVGEASTLAHRPSCPGGVASTPARPAAVTSPLAMRPAANSAPAGASDRVTAAAGAQLICATAAPASSFVTMNGAEQALSPPAATAATTSGRPGMC
jgi:hypothetical protein